MNAMTQVNATIAGRQFRLACEDGQQDHLHALANDMDTRIEGLRQRFGEIGDTRLTVMAALMVADELEDAKQRLRLTGRARGGGRPRQAGFGGGGQCLQLGG
jgi:cell division protein ZapA